ncbi:MAG: hypothetical protein ACPGUC_03995, partial [Gammaproteobacteria bacterium]
QATSAWFHAHIVAPLGLTRVPNPPQLWIMGFVGIAAGLISRGRFLVESGAAEGGTIVQVISYFEFLCFAPLLIPLIPAMLPANQAGTRRPFGDPTWVLLYLPVLATYAIAINSRGSMVEGIVAVLIVASFLVLSDQAQLKREHRGLVLVSVLIALFAAPVVKDLSTAMLIARSARATDSTPELVDRTWEAFQDKRALREFELILQAARGSGFQDEHYIANPFLNRLVVVKYIDNTLHPEGIRNGDFRDEIARFTVNKTLAALPAPALRMLGSDLDKDEWKFSFGDLVVTLEYGVYLGGYKLGSVVSNVFALFGMLSFLVVVPLNLLAFTVLQSLIGKRGSLIVISPALVFQTYVIFHLYAIGSLPSILGLVARGIPQTVAIYLLIFWLTYPLTRGRGHAQKPAAAPQGSLAS